MTRTETGKLNIKERREKGKLKNNIFVKYFGLGGFCSFLSVMFFIVVTVLFKILGDYWVGIWTTNRLNLELRTYVIVYSLLVLGVYVFGCVRSFLWSWFTTKISLKIFTNLLNNILKKPVSYFDTTPMGQILNLMGKDIDIIENILPDIGITFVSLFFLFCGTLIMSAILNVFMIPLIVGLVFLYGYFIKIYLKLNLELKRLELISYSPILSNILEIYEGILQLRVYKQMDSREIVFSKNVNRLMTSMLHQKFSMNTFMLYSEMIMSFLILFSFIFLIVGILYGFPLIPTDITLIAVCLSWIFNIPNFILFMCYFYTEYIQAMGSFERVVKNVDPDLSEGLRLTPKTKSADFPSQGKIEISNIKCRYRDNLPLVLDGLTFEVKEKENVAIVGRTGSGKSSLFLALTRIINIENNLYYPTIAKMQKLDSKSSEYGTSPFKELPISMKQFKTPNSKSNFLTNENK